MPAQSEPNPTPGLVWPTVEELRADYVRISEAIHAEETRIANAKDDALKFQRELMASAWIGAAHEQLHRTRLSGYLVEQITVHCPNGLEQPTVAVWILQDVVATLQSVLPGASVRGYDGNEVDNCSVTIDWSIKS